MPRTKKGELKPLGGLREALALLGKPAQPSYWDETLEQRKKWSYEVFHKIGNVTSMTNWRYFFPKETEQEEVQEAGEVVAFNRFKGSAFESRKGKEDGAA